MQRIRPANRLQRPLEAASGPDQLLRRLFKTQFHLGRSKSAQENVIDTHSETLFSCSDRQQSQGLLP